MFGMPQFDAWFAVIAGYSALALLAMGATFAHFPRWFSGPITSRERQAARQGFVARNLVPWLQILLAGLAVVAAARLVLLAERPMNLYLLSRSSPTALFTQPLENTVWCPAIDLGPAVDHLLDRLEARLRSERDGGRAWQLDTDANRELLAKFVAEELSARGVALPVLAAAESPSRPKADVARHARWMVESLEITVLEHLLSTRQIASATIATTPLPEVADAFDWSIAARILHRAERPVVADGAVEEESESRIRYIIDPMYDLAKRELSYTLVLSPQAELRSPVNLHLLAERRQDTPPSGTSAARSKVEKVADISQALGGELVQSFSWKDDASAIALDPSIAYYLVDERQGVRARIRFQSSKLAILCGPAAQSERWLKWREEMRSGWAAEIGKELARAGESLPRFVDGSSGVIESGETSCYLDFDPVARSWLLARDPATVAAFRSSSSFAKLTPQSVPAAYRATIDKTGVAALSASGTATKGSATIFSWDRQTVWEPSGPDPLHILAARPIDPIVVAPTRYGASDLPISGRRPVVSTEEPCHAIVLATEGRQEVVVISVSGITNETGTAIDPWPAGFDRQGALLRSVVWGAMRITAAETAPIVAAPIAPLQGTGALPLASADLHREIVRESRETFDFASLFVIGFYLLLLSWRAVSQRWEV